MKCYEHNNNIIIIINIYVYMFLQTYRATPFSSFTSIHSLYLVHLFIFNHSRTLLVRLLMSGDD